MDSIMLRYLTYDDFLEYVKNNKIDHDFLLDLYRCNKSEHLLDILKYIVNNNLSTLVGIKNQNGLDFIHILCIFNDNLRYLLDILKWLVDIIDISIKSEQGNNFLHLLCLNYRLGNTTNVDRNLLDILKWIVNNDIIDISIKNYYGRNFLHLLLLYETDAESKYITEILEWIIDDNIFMLNNVSDILVDDMLINLYRRLENYDIHILEELKSMKDRIYSNTKSASKNNIV